MGSREILCPDGRTTAHTGIFTALFCSSALSGFPLAALTLTSHTPALPPAQKPGCTHTRSFAQVVPSLWSLFSQILSWLASHHSAFAQRLAPQSSLAWPLLVKLLYVILLRFLGIYRHLIFSYFWMFTVCLSLDTGNNLIYSIPETMRSITPPE